MECNCNNNNSNGGVIPWVRGNRLPLIICVYENVVTQEQVGDSTLTVNEMTRVPYVIQDNDTVTVIMKSGFRQVEMPFTTDGNKVMVTDNGELAAGTYTVEVTIVRGDGARGRWQETRQVRVYENTSDAQLGEMYAIEADLFFYAKGDTGNGIADITSNPDDTLTITMTDGTTYTTKAMRGEKGDKGDKGDTGTSIVSFESTGQTDVSVVYTVTFSDDTTQEVAVPKGPQGDTGLTGNGIASTTLNSDYTLTVNYTDGTSYTTPSIRGAQGVQGVSIIAFTQTGETSTNTLYNLVFSDGRTQSVAIPKGVKGDKGDTGDTGAIGAQGPKGDTVTATDYTLYNVQGGSSEGAMSQDAITKAISAQTGYYTCGTAAGTPEKVVTVENGNLYKRTLGGHFKVKMTNKNTASGVTLQIGSETAAPLLYNGMDVSDSNTWEANEVISVYFDGTNYQASNAQGGGSAVGKKKLTPISGYIENYSNTLGPIHTSGQEASEYVYIKYPVDSGDVIKLSGEGRSVAMLWGIVGDNNVILRNSGSNVTEKDLVMVMPEGAKFITLNSRAEAAPEWYFAKKGSVGAHEMLTEAYLYGDVRLLAVGQTYEKNEAVRTENKQLLRITKDINPINITDTVSAGDVKTSGANTYEAQKAVGIYSGDDTSYNDGDYAIGSFSEYALTAVAGSAEGNITINDTAIAITEGETAAEIAAAIVANITIDGWTLSNSGDVVTVKCNTIGNNITSITFEDTDSTGVTISGNTTPSVTGSAIVRVFDGSVWADVELADYVADTSVWYNLSEEELMNFTVPNTLLNTLRAGNTIYDNVKGTIDAENVQEALDKLNVIDSENADLSTGYSMTGRFALNDVWTLNQRAVMFMLPRPKWADTIKIVSNAITRFAFLKYNDVTAHTAVKYCDNSTIFILEDSDNVTKIYDIPKDCTYIYFDYSYNQVDRFPHSILFMSTAKGQTVLNNESISNLYNLNGATKLQWVKKSMRGITSGMTVRDNYVIASMYPVKPCQKILIAGAANFVWLQEDTLELNYFKPSNYFRGWCECDESGAELYAAPDCHFILIEGSEADVYAFEEYKDFNEHGTDLLSLASYVENRVIRYAYHTYIRTMHGGGYKSALTGIGSTRELTHRCPAILVHHLELMLYSKTLDLGLIGTTKFALRNQCIRYIQALVDAYSLWANKWQSSITITHIANSSCRLYRDGYMTQELYDSVKNILITECDYIINKPRGERWQDNYVFDLYWKDINGRELYNGDSKAEEVGWYAGCLGTACALCQDAPNIQEYRRKFVEFSIISNAAPSDIGKNETYNGYSLTNLEGSNITDDGITINHQLIHPDYMASRSLCVFACVHAFEYARMALPSATLFNMRLVLDGFINYKFTSEKYLGKYQTLPPYGEIMKDGSNYPYFPMGNDWGTVRQDPEASYFSYMYALSQSPRYDCSRTAAAIMASFKRLQDRFETHEQSGRIIANASENSYGTDEDAGMMYANIASAMACPLGVVEILTSDITWTDEDWYNN